jgi:CRP/FNR family nitrogen fixation transcriptional regulator
MLHWQSTAKAGKVISFDAVRQARSGRSVNDMIDMMGACMNFDRNAEIFGEDEPAEYFYKVVSGAVRISKLMSDGRRQIGAFYLPGNIFGLEAGDTHHFSAEAIGNCNILVVKRSAFLAEATRDGATVAELWSETMGHLQRAQDHMLLLGRKNAQERIAAFLLDMAGRLSRQGAVELPMSRQDIADYLGLTIETVSRTLTQMERNGVISIPVSRRILLRDPAALGQMNDCLAA